MALVLSELTYMCLSVCRALEARLSAQALEVDKSASAISAREMQLTQRETSLDQTIQLDKSTRSGSNHPMHTLIMRLVSAN
jgi:hypothetical protein